MKRTVDTLPFAADIAAIPFETFAEMLADAYRADDRQSFILLGQRLAWAVACNTIRAPRLIHYRLDMYSVGVVALIEQFDRLSGDELESPYGYFRRVVYYAMLQFLYRQRVLIRKGAKRARILLCDTDVSGRDCERSSVIDNCPAAPECPELSLEDAIAFCLEAVARANRQGNKPATKRATGTGDFDPTVADTPAQLRERGYTWKAIGKLLGVCPTVACHYPNRTPEQLRQQKAAARQNRLIGRARDRGKVARNSVTCDETISRGPKVGNGALMAFDPTITATPKELRELGYTWKAIGELLGISLTAAHHAAHKCPDKTPAELRQQALVSQRLREKARKQLVAA